MFCFVSSAKNEKSPLIVVDLMYFLCAGPTTSRKEQLCGGRSDRFLANVTSFFGSLKSLGVRMVFFSTAYTKDEDYEKWSQKAMSRYEKEISVLDLLYEGASLQNAVDFCIENKIYISLQKLKNHAVYRVARQSGKIFKMHDISKAVATYANANNAFAVLGNNSDYLIFEGNWRYWNASKLNMHDMTVLEMNKEYLRKHLRLSCAQMPLLATILGNHIIESKAVEKFHSVLVMKPLVPVLANIISKSTNEIPDEEDITTMITLVFEFRFDKNIIQKSLDYYCVVSFLYKHLLNYLNSFLVLQYFNSCRISMSQK